MKDKVKLTVFIILHATRHNAGIIHDAKGTYIDKLGYGYMSSGNDLRWMLGKDTHGRAKYHPTINSIEALIEYTVQNHADMIDIIRTRYE